MLSKATIEHNRRLTPDEKWRAMFDAIEAAWQHLSSLPAEEMEKRIAYLRKRHDLSNRLMMERMLKHG
jgi:hypothetical protein